MTDLAKKKRLYRMLLLTGGILLLCFVVYLLHLPCLVLAATGYTCPACGTQRMLDAILQGDLGGAFVSNPLMLFLLPAAGIYYVVKAAGYIKKGTLKTSVPERTVFIVILVVALVFAVSRNVLTS